MGKKYSVFFFELKNSTLPLAGGVLFFCLVLTFFLYEVII